MADENMKKETSDLKTANIMVAGKTGTGGHVKIRLS